MTITARYPGKCKACGGQIQAGEQIEWSKSSGARHTDCKAAGSTSRQASPKRRRPVTRCVKCGDPLDAYQQRRGYRTCLDCKDGGSRYMGGASYYDRHGNFVLGDDD